jgi:TPR repeat protein
MEEHINSPFFKESIIAAKYNLALSYQKGEGVDKDKKKAFELLMQCQEDPDAQREIGDVYQHGSCPGIPINKEKAKEWYSRAANNKLPDYESCLHLARMYEDVSVKDKANYFLKGIKRESIVKKYNNMNSLPKSYHIPTDVILYYEAKITKLKQKILELECAPPQMGGKLYLQAKANFENNIKTL